MVTILWQNLKKPKPENDTGVIMEDVEDDEITGIDEVNSSLAEGAVTRALYGDEQGIVSHGGCYGDSFGIAQH